MFDGAVIGICRYLDVRLLAPASLAVAHAIFAARKRRCTASSAERTNDTQK
jgi:hypothetical protein